MINRYAVQTYLTSHGYWDDVSAYTTITEAVSGYKFYCEEYPSCAHRIIQVFEVEE